MKVFPLTLALAVLFAPGPNLRGQDAQTPPTLDVSVENRTALAELEVGVPRADSTSRPGDVLRFHLVFTNHLDRPIRNVVLHNPIPEGTRFISGSPAVDREDAVLEMSADGGLTFSQAPTEEVLVDGRLQTRPVPPERFTDVRWTVPGWVEPGASVSAHFEVRVGSGEVDL